MSDIVSNARAARESLAKGLNLLQMNPNAPPDYLQAAEPIAVAMGALHRIEVGGAPALNPSADQALEAVRSALSMLQGKAATDPQMMQTMEAVASSLGTVFSLTKMAEQAQPPVQAQPQQAPYQPPVQAQPQQAPYQPPVQAQPQPAPHQPPPQQAPYQPPVQAQPQPAPYQPPPQQAPYQPPVQAQPQPAPYQPPQPAPYQPQPAPYQPPQQQAPYQPPPQAAQPPQQAQPAYAPPPQQAQPAYAPPPQQQAPRYAPPPQPAQQPYAPPQGGAPFQPPGVAQAAQQPQAAPFQPPVQPAPAGGGVWSESDPFAAPAPAQAQPQQAPPAASSTSSEPYRGGDLPAVEAELGTHSPTNFYKGLSGNDIIDHGGLFIATYNVPPVGQTMKVQVALPGGYEFEAVGIVRWTRESRESMTSDVSPPGFGIQFTHITPEARQLVYRYVRNREPLFHDDL
jgi:PilZ domain